MDTLDIRSQALTCSCTLLFGVAGVISSQNERQACERILMTASC